MFAPEKREAALELYDRLGSVRAVVAELGYPSVRCLYGWIARRDGAGRARPRAVRCSAQEKAAAARRVLSGERCADVAADVGVSAATVLNWRRAYVEEGVGALMTGDDVRRPGPRADAGSLPDDAGELKRMVLELQLENDLMRQVVELLKKDPGVDPARLSNREKAQVIDAMRGTYSLVSVNAFFTDSANGAQPTAQTRFHRSR
ncbi:MAG TPA: helix-turn-helix domain-containing protein [Collinsella ihuae]|uniref:Helix-turn-helix domain-containing protein n=1 Tax=Collinsella ihumii TaxID=1720204 RepID=A0A921IR56_9ACTN|nr:helix-turn-helix domain-containing protein [Collinsella ihumii]